MYAFEYLTENMEWLKDQLGDEEDDYYIIDLPGPNPTPPTRCTSKVSLP